MTEKMFFDTDCFSSFLMVGREDIILMKFKGRIVIRNSFMMNSAARVFTICVPKLTICWQQS